MKPEIKQIFLDRISIEKSPKVRSECSEEAMKEYTKQYRRDKAAMPPIVLFQVGQCPLMIGDGLHRYHSMIAAGIKVAPCEVREGTFEDCLKFALRANVSHGLRRTNEDKRTAVELALKTFPKYTNVQISDIAAVGDDLVSEVRKSMEVNGEIEKTTTRIGKDGQIQPVQKQDRVRKTNPSEGSNHENKGKSQDSKSEGVVLSGPKRDAGGDKANVVLDDTGYEVPAKAMVYWERREEVQEMLTMVSRLRTKIEQAFTDDDRLYTAEINKVTILADLGRVFTQLGRAKPYAVCPYCQGKLVDKCAACKQRGVISHFKYDTQVDKKIKDVREAAIKKSK